MARIFVYDGREFNDPDPAMSTEDVKRQMTNFYPELATAEIREHVRGDNVFVELVKRVGTKG